MARTRTRKYEHQLKTYEHDYGVTIYLITNKVDKRSFRKQYSQHYYVGQTRDEYKRLSRHNRNEDSGAYPILQHGGAMYTLGAVDLAFCRDGYDRHKYTDDTYESILISLVRYITADYSPYYKSYTTNNKDYYTVDLLRYKLCNLQLFPIHLNEELIKTTSKYKFDSKNYEELCEVIAKYHQLDEDSISHWATIMTLTLIKSTEYEDAYNRHLKGLEAEERNAMYRYET